MLGARLRQPWQIKDDLFLEVGMRPDLLRGRAYFERTGLTPTYRNPGARAQPGHLKVHTAKMSAPLPLPETRVYSNGDEPPDRVQTEPWHLPDEA